MRKEDTEFYIKYLVHEFSDVVITDFKGYFYRDNPNSAMHITNKNAFTSFGASERIKRYLIDNGIQMSYNKMLYASIQGYCVGLALGKNKELYEELHKLYSVKEVMISLLKHPRMLRRIVAFVYLLLGKSLFYNSLTLIGK